MQSDVTIPYDFKTSTLHPHKHKIHLTDNPVSAHFAIKFTISISICVSVDLEPPAIGLLATVNALKFGGMGGKGSRRVRSASVCSVVIQFLSDYL